MGFTLDVFIPKLLKNERLILKTPVVSTENLYQFPDDKTELEVGLELDNLLDNCLFSLYSISNEVIFLITLPSLIKGVNVKISSESFLDLATSNELTIEVGILLTHKSLKTCVGKI